MTESMAKLSGSDVFNLVDRPWIKVRLLDNTVEDVSLRQAFEQADRIREIVGELPTQRFAILRLMLAVMYRALGADATTVTNWGALWGDGLPVDDISEYLDRFRDRFDLLHPERPFFQVADLRTSKDEVRDVGQLIFDLPSNNRLFTTRSGAGIARLSFAEAARSLVNLHAFDASGIKSGAVGDTRVIGGRGYPIGVAWAGLLGGLFAEGTSLAQTLLLNLVADQRLLTIDWERDLPAWERTEAFTAGELDDPHPHGPAQLYTWQSRRVRLVSDGSGIIGALICNGDKLTPQNLFRIEPMTAWRRSEPQSKKLGQTVYMPREHQPARAFWRGIAGLLPQSGLIRTGKDASASLPPAIVQWISQLQELGLIETGGVVALHAVGVVYGSNNSVIDELLDDRMLVPVALLNEQDPELGHDAVLAVSLAEQGVWELKKLAENLAKAAGGDGEGPQTRVEELAYSALDEPYRRWLLRHSSTDSTTSLKNWKREARDIIHDIGTEQVRTAGTSAWRGRHVGGRNGTTELITTSRADGWFRLGLHKIFSDAPSTKGEAA